MSRDEYLRRNQRILVNLETALEFIRLAVEHANDAAQVLVIDDAAAVLELKAAVAHLMDARVEVQRMKDRR